MQETVNQNLAVKLRKKIRCSQFIDCNNPWSSTSFDEDEDGFVEIKCTPSENLTMKEAIKMLSQVKNIFYKKHGNKINQNHNFFY